MTEPNKVQVLLGPVAAERARRLRVASDAATLSEVARNALHFYDWCLQQHRLGRVVGAGEASGAPMLVEVPVPFLREGR